MSAKVLRTVLPFVLLAAGAQLAYILVKGAPKAERKAQAPATQLVELVDLKSEKRNASVRATGVVTPQQEVRLSPQISGKVTYIAKSLVPGGRVKKGEVLVRIDARDYRLAVEQLKGQVQSGALQVEQEQAQQALARHEWELLGEEGEAPPLFSRESQKAAAEANLHAGKSALSQARLNLSRTTLTAPFDATIVSKGVDVGQIVTPQSMLVHLVGTGGMWVVASVPVEDLDLVRVPGLGGETASKATVTQRLARGKSIVRQGEVTRLVEQLDDRTRRAQLVITIEDALTAKGRLPLLPGAYVEIDIAGRAFDGVFTLPREAIYEGNVAWVAEPKDEKTVLAPRQIESAWGSQDQLFVTKGLNEGEQLVVTRLSSPLRGTEVKALEATPVASPVAAQSSEPAAETPAEAKTR